MGEIYKKYGKIVIFPIHPRTKKSIIDFGLKIPKGIKLFDPVGFLEFSKLEKNAFCCVTDSGTVQEDSCIFRVPCVTIRISTERSETVEVGSNIVAGVNMKHILDAVEKMINKKRNWKNPYGKPDCSKQILKILEKKDNEICSPKIWWDQSIINSSKAISQYKTKWKNHLVPDEIF